MIRGLGVCVATAILLMATGSVCLAQIDSAASKVANRYLEGLRIFDLPEGKKLLQGIEWQPPSYPYQTYTEAVTLYEGMFDTDVRGVQGYKRLVLLKTMSEGGQSVNVRYLLVAYRDKKLGEWKVYDFTKGTDTGKEVAYFGGRLDADIELFGETIRQTNYRRYSHWLVMDGKLREGLQALEKAIALNRKNPSKGLHHSVLETEAVNLRRIIGEQMP